MQPDFVHPLSALETIDTEEGKKQVINSWAFASILWSQALTGNQNALMMVNELFTNKDEMLTFIKDSQAGNNAAARSAIAIMAFALDEKIQEVFEAK
ncbi:hypothetical protein C7B67_08485 [filamentous cyanobacterium Phorm 6]|nr:hypothetical protein C7B67_08485 [filamentous cyanobacterium Phorm 6]